MCGIAGILSANTSLVSIDRLKKMTDALMHRGPDGSGSWINETATAALGHRRLSIIDLSEAGHQPMNYRNRYRIIHNGEVYNYLELKNELIRKGYRFSSRTDTEVIAASYDLWGDDCLEHFDGMFSFAIWDEEKNELFAARDRFGEKPFFYALGKDHFVFASEMKGLWAAGFPKTPNLKMLFNFLTIGYTGNPARPEETFYENIFKLPPACFLKYRPIESELVTEKYWEIESMGENRLTDEEAVQSFSDLLHQSLERRWRSDVMVGSSVSGGLDSSSIVALSRTVHSGQNSHKCFTASFPGFEKDETAYAVAVADRFDLHHFTIPAESDGLIRDWERLCEHQEEPFGSSSIYAQYKVYQLAAAQDVTVLLDGQGADEILAGYHRYFKWYWQELFRKRRLMRSGELKAAHNLGVTEKFGIRNIMAALFPELASMILEHRYLLHALQQEELTKDFIKHQSKDAYYMTPPAGTLNSRLYFNTCVYGLEELLRYADRNSMAHSREVRLPYLSHELVEFVFSLPANFKIRGGWTKWILRKAMEDKLPENITWRRDKVGYEPPQYQWMQHKKVQELIFSSREILVKEKIVKPLVLDKPVRTKNAHEADNLDWRYLASSMLFK